MVGLNQAAHRDRAQIDDDEFPARFEHLRGRRLERDRESRRTLAQAEKNHLGRATECPRFCQCEQRIGNAGSLLEDHRLARDEIGARLPVVLECRERSCIRASLACALDRACGIAEARLGAEIRTRGHAMAPKSMLCHSTVHDASASASRKPKAPKRSRTFAGVRKHQCSTAKRAVDRTCPPLAFSWRCADIRAGGWRWTR